jgi:hypothetical protein
VIFNAFWGTQELELFMAAGNLLNANTNGEPTFPSFAPRHQFGFCVAQPLYQGESLCRVSP